MSSGLATKTGLSISAWVRQGKARHMREAIVTIVTYKEEQYMHNDHARIAVQPHG